MNAHTLAKKIFFTINMTDAWNTIEHKYRGTDRMNTLKPGLVVALICTVVYFYYNSKDEDTDE